MTALALAGAGWWWQRVVRQLTSDYWGWQAAVTLHCHNNFLAFTATLLPSKAAVWRSSPVRGSRPSELQGLLPSLLPGLSLSAAARPGSSRLRLRPAQCVRTIDWFLSPAAAHNIELCYHPSCYCSSQPLTFWWLPNFKCPSVWEGGAGVVWGWPRVARPS